MKILICIVLALISMFFNATAIQYLFNCFIAPLGFKTIVFAHAYGVMLFVGYFYMMYNKNTDVNDKEKLFDKYISYTVQSMVGCAGAFLFGYIATLFM